MCGFTSTYLYLLMSSACVLADRKSQSSNKNFTILAIQQKKKPSTEMKRILFTMKEIVIAIVYCVKS